MTMKAKFPFIFISALFSVFIFVQGTIFAEETQTVVQQASESVSVSETVPPAEDQDSSGWARAASGFSNMVYAPIELVYRMKEEIKRTDPVRGFIPGLVKGIGWFGMREGVGIFELVTFYLPHQPILKPFDTDWLYA